MTLETIQWIVRILLAAAFILMGVLHFVPGPARGMAAMIPAPLRFRKPFDPRFLVAFTGLCEIAGGVGLLLPALHTLAGILLCAMPRTPTPPAAPRSSARWPRPSCRASSARSSSSASARSRHGRSDDRALMVAVTDSRRQRGRRSRRL
jgi:hypothetical protein